MKRIILSLLVTALILAGCSGNGTSSSAVTSEFFKGKIEGEITVSAYDHMMLSSFLEEAAKIFELMYPGTKVNVVTYTAMPVITTGEADGYEFTSMQSSDTPQDRADYISRVNVDIMSGRGADIYVMDILPIHKFVKSGVLENLDHYMNTDPGFNKNDYRLNIIEAVRYQNGIWFLPLDYQFDYYAYDSALIPAEIARNFGINRAYTAEELIGMTGHLYNGVNKIFNQMVYTTRGSGLYNIVLNENYRSFVNLDTGRPYFLDGRFVSMLDSLKNYGEQGFVPQSITSQNSAEQALQWMTYFEDLSNRVFIKQYSDMHLLFALSKDGGIGSMATMSSGIEEDDEIAGIVANADGTVPFRFTRAFAVNSQSKNKLTAWTFIKFLMSKEMQLSIFTLPVHNEAREEKSELSFTGAIYGIENPMTERMRIAYNNYRNIIETLSDMINTFVVQDSNLNEMISQEVQYFFDGSRTAEEVARALQNKADLYLSE